MSDNIDYINNLTHDTAVPKQVISKLFTVKKNDAQGDCLFNSFGELIYGDQHRHRKIRRMVCDFYARFNTSAAYPSDSLEEKIQMAIIADDMDDDERLHSLAVCDEYVYGNFTDVVICALLFDCSVILFDFSNSSRITARPILNENGRSIVHLKFNGVDHFEAMIPKGGAKTTTAAAITRKRVSASKTRTPTKKLRTPTKKTSPIIILSTPTPTKKTRTPKKTTPIVISPTNHIPIPIFHDYPPPFALLTPTKTATKKTMTPIKTPTKKSPRKRTPPKRTPIRTKKSPRKKTPIPNYSDLYLKSLHNRLKYDNDLTPSTTRNIKEEIKLLSEK